MKNKTIKNVAIFVKLNGTRSKKINSKYKRW